MLTGSKNSPGGMNSLVKNKALVFFKISAFFFLRENFIRDVTILPEWN